MLALPQLSTLDSQTNRQAEVRASLTIIFKTMVTSTSETRRTCRGPKRLECLYNRIFYEGLGMITPGVGYLNVFPPTHTFASTPMYLLIARLKKEWFSTEIFVAFEVRGETHDPNPDALISTTIQTAVMRSFTRSIFAERTACPHSAVVSPNNLHA